MSAITYLLQVSGCMAIFYLFYYLFLNRLTFFTINRYYLVCTLVLSFVIPALTIPVHEQVHTVAQTVINNNPVQTQRIHDFITPVRAVVAPGPSINWLQVLKIAYLIIAAGLFVRLLITLTAFFARLKHNGAKRVGHIHILQGNKKLTNGSFFNYIFLNDDELSPAEIQQVIAHEMLHVKLFHSADRVLAKMIQIILWFNPFAYFYTRSIEENHEFEVDCEIARSADKNGYADLLLHLSVAASGMLYNNFSTVPLKKRITMLFNKPSAKAKKLVYVLAIPVLLLSCMAFATFKKIQNVTIAHKLIKPLKNTSIRTPYSNAKIYKITAENIQEKTIPAPQVNEILPTITQLVTDSTWDLNLIYGTKGMGSNPLVLIDGKEYNKDILYKISPSCVRATASYLPEGGLMRFGPKAKDGCIELKTKNGQLIDITPLEKENLVHESSISPAKFYNRIEIKKADGTSYDKIIMNVSPGGSVMSNLTHNGKAAFYIDNVFYTEEAMKKLSPEIIASFTGEYGVGPAHPDTKGYEIAFEFNIKKN